MSSSNTYMSWNCYTAIICNETNGDNPLGYNVKTVTYTTESTVPKEDNVIGTQYCSLPLNSVGSLPTGYFEIHWAILATKSENPQGSLANCTAFKGHGLIIEIFTISERPYDKTTVVSIIKHCDYNIEVCDFICYHLLYSFTHSNLGLLSKSKEMLKFTAAYCCRPIRNPQSMQSLCQVDCEVVVSGCVIEFDMPTGQFIIELHSADCIIFLEKDTISASFNKSDNLLLFFNFFSQTLEKCLMMFEILPCTILNHLGKKSYGNKAYTSEIKAQAKRPGIFCKQPSSNLTLNL